jgi:hypothetical protein
MFVLTTTQQLPGLFGLVWYTRQVELGTFESWNDAVSYAFNVCKFQHDYEFTVTHKKGEPSCQTYASQ